MIERHPFSRRVVGHRDKMGLGERKKLVESKGKGKINTTQKERDRRVSDEWQKVAEGQGKGMWG